MNSSYTLTLTGSNTAQLHCNFTPEIILDDNDYCCALLDLTIVNTNSNEIELNEIRINCNLISNSYINGEQSRVIHQFVANTPLKQSNKLVVIPKHLNFFPVNVKRLRTIHINIVDSKGYLVNIVKGDIICRIVIKRDSKHENLQ